MFFLWLIVDDFLKFRRGFIRNQNSTFSKSSFVSGKSRLQVFGFVFKNGNLLKSCLLFFAFFLLFRKLGSKNKKTRVSKSTTSHLDFAKWWGRV
jgi:hypothetical protein